ncbi:hypothetical protein F0342_18455 [Bacillus sp. CH30_1T]|uniref:hypothetical protein n=1 Tax=Bacillus sp. CH30_1T TaxID=2604836 RepID=UPI0011ED7D82|nr:hypothetical protein [Bacillus sp. CH30_1T]KAA0561786.1 hypothetical protein F0342_18455 [Bacillus sp. CH30_1T]
MDNTDKRNRLDESPFQYRVNKDQSVFIEHEGKRVKILKGREAEKFIKNVNAAENDKAVQLVMAKITGNFKRGNERKKR